MSTNIIAATGQTARKRAQIDFNELDVGTIAIALVWLGLYLVMLIGAIVDYAFASAVALSGYY